LFDAFLVIALNDAMHEDAGQVDFVGIERPCWDDLFDFYHTWLLVD
jgi:hypothetical protein